MSDSYKTKKRVEKVAPFKKALTLTMRAISEDHELEVIYGVDRPSVSGQKARLPDPSFVTKAQEITLLRGSADMLALTHALHNENMHTKLSPPDPTAKSVFNMAEQARIAAVGASQMKGMATNLNADFAEKLKKRGVRKPTSTEDAPMDIALALLLREKIAGLKPPTKYAENLNLWRDYFDDKAGDLLNNIANNKDDQFEFAKDLYDLLRAFDMGNDLGDLESNQDQDMNDSAEGGAQEAGLNDADEEAEEGETDCNDEMQGENPEDSDQMMDADSDQVGDFEDADGDEDASENESSELDPNHPNFDPEKAPYSAYSTEFDEIIHAEEICEEFELVKLREHLDNQMQNLQGAVSRLANKLMRLLLAQQNRSWEFDLEEGLLDAAKLARVIADPLLPLSFKQEKDTDFKDTIVTLLIDNSGSMRGRPITIAAICGDVLARTLERCNVKVEILGFTTRAWKGGQSRENWLNQNKPKHPGRLNDLRHIIYKRADTPYRRSKNNLGLMMREGLLKENIDGEALSWAHNRLLARPEHRRILMVISDGAPVDDSTLSANVGNYLEKHLREMIAYIENKSPIELVAIGIGHDVTRYYDRAITINDAEELGGAITNQLAELFVHDVKTRKNKREK
ncbi:MAG: cobaltochelatase subunit CobT [Rhizobiales bacterium]|nr:cobaltochelatase subunit CobT [Hyphomicrobiales bacterium]